MALLFVVFSYGACKSMIARACIYGLVNGELNWFGLSLSTRLAEQVVRESVWTGLSVSHLNVQCTAGPVRCVHGLVPDSSEIEARLSSEIGFIVRHSPRIESVSAMASCELVMATDMIIIIGCVFVYVVSRYVGSVFAHRKHDSSCMADAQSGTSRRSLRRG